MKRIALASVMALVSTLALPVAAGNLVVDGKLISTAPPGTAPLEVSSDTVVDNLNADLLDGLHAADFFSTANHGAGSGLDADLLDGLHASAFARSLGNVVRVGTTGGDFTSIQAALDSITTAAAGNPFLVVVGPGIYLERVVMKPFVDIQGAGEGVTIIRQAGSTSPDFGTVAAADDSELRFLTVENVGGSTGSIGIYNVDSSPRLVHVTVRVEGSSGATSGMFNDSTHAGPFTPLLDRVSFDVEGTQVVWGVVMNPGMNARMRDVRIAVRGGGSNDKIGVSSVLAAPVLHGVDVTVDSSATTGFVYGVYSDGASGADYRRVRVTLSGGADRTGVYTRQSELTIRDLEVEVSGSSSGITAGVYNDLATVVLEGCSIEVAGGSDSGSLSSALTSWDADSAISDCTLTALPGAGDEFALRAVFDAAASLVTVQHSRLTGDEGAITGMSNVEVRVGASQLAAAGVLLGAATYTCVVSYDGLYTPLNSNCTPSSP